MNKYVLVINSLGVGGAERVATLLANDLSRSGKMNVIVLDDSNIGYDLDAEVVFTVLPFGKLFRFFFPILFFVQALFLARAISKFDRDENVKCICFLHRAGIVTAFASMLLNKDFVYSERSVFSKSYTKIKGAILKPLLKLTLKRASKVLAISRVANQEVKMLSKREGVIIHNPVDTEMFSPRYRQSERENRIVCVGRLVELKRFDFAIRLLKYINRERADKFILDIVGDGPKKPDLIELANSLGVASYTKFHGFSSDPAEILSKGKVCLICSEYESFGNVAIEALACGLPVLYSSHLNSLNEVLNSSVSEKFEFYDFQSASAALKILLKDLSEYSDNARELAGSFSTDIIFSKYKILIG